MPGTRLLVSVVDFREAAEAVGAGADVIDAKDPSRGALGALGRRALAGILRTCPSNMETSAALGDIGTLRAADALEDSGAPGDADVRADGGRPESGFRLPRAPRKRRWPAGLTYVKVGLGGWPAGRNSARALAGLLARLGAHPGEVAPGTPCSGVAGRRVSRVEPSSAPRLILAAYADYRRAQAPPPESVPALARSAGASGCLLDTAVKDGSCLLDWIEIPALARFVAACRAAGLLCALAGSLRAEHLTRVAALGPDLVGVRGAACDGDRVRGRVRAVKVAALAAALRSAPAA